MLYERANSSHLLSSISPVLKSEIGKNGSAWQTLRLTTPHLRVLVVADEVEEEGALDPLIVPVLVQIAHPLTAIETSLSNLLFGLGAISLVLLVFTNLLTFALTGRLLRPLKEMASTADQITERELSRRLPVEKPGDEIGQLASAFNRLFGRIEKAFESQRRFSSDASHELRTPLSVIRGKLELALRKDRTSDEYRQVIASSLAHAEKLSTLAERLLLLARADAGKLLVERHPLQLDQLCQVVCSEMQILAGEKMIRLDCDCAEPVQILGDGNLLRQVAFNLLDNAMKYTAAGGRITASVRKEAGYALLQIKDSGIGIASDELAHIFERFYRADKSRSHEIPGTGLGLAITREVVLAHGGDISIDSALNQGTTATVRLPM